MYRAWNCIFVSQIRFVFFFFCSSVIPLMRKPCTVKNMIPCHLQFTQLVPLAHGYYKREELHNAQKYWKCFTIIFTWHHLLCYLFNGEWIFPSSWNSSYIHTAYFSHYIQHQLNLLYSKRIQIFGKFIFTLVTHLSIFALYTQKL